MRRQASWLFIPLVKNKRHREQRIEFNASYCVKAPVCFGVQI
jgi:hypothetical protein